jgi:hypothetical protein
VSYCSVVSAGSCLANVTAHGDYVRAAHTHTTTQSNMYVTGSYDHTVKLWDIRNMRSDSGSAKSASDHSSGAMTVSADHDDDDDDGDLDMDGEDAEEDADGTDGDSDSSGSDEGSTGSGKNGSAADSDADEDSDDEIADADESDNEDAGAGASMRNSTRRSSDSAAMHRHGEILSVDHGEPVTQVMMLPNNSSFLTVGGTSV